MAFSIFLLKILSPKYFFSNLLGIMVILTKDVFCNLSISSNIAEGFERQTTKEFIQFLYIARGSLFEVVTLLIIFQKAGWLESKRLIQLRELAEEITKMLNSFIKAMKNN